MSLENSVREIDRRGPEKVVGIDLVQAMNFIKLNDVSVDFIYNRYTSSTLVYKSSSRPRLEEVSKEITKDCPDQIGKVRALAQFVATKVRWAGYYQMRTGQRLAPDRNMTEEQLIESGDAWCNEQVRVMCALTQVIGITSRMVFADNPKYGSYANHVVTEVLLSTGWMMVDQSLGCCFAMDDKPVRAVDVLGDKDLAMLYKGCCAKLKHDLGNTYSDTTCFFYTEDPLLLFKNLGFYNYFIL